MTDFAGNDYLGLARDPRLADALCRAAREDRISATSSRWGLGWTEHHERLEGELAEFFRAEAACILGAAYFGGLVYFTTLADRPRTVFCDANSHSNLFLGMRAAGMEIRTFHHLDSDDLRRQLADYEGDRAIVASDSVFGISGELADLAALQRIAREHEAEFLIDDAHGVFGMGETGRGAMEACGIELDERTTLMGSMSKSLGVNGGFLVGRAELVENFRRNPTASGSSVPPIPIAAACREGLRIVREEPQLLERLNANARRMRRTLAEAGIDTVCDRTPIVAMVLADEFEAARLDRHFLEHGLRIPYFKYASEPRENLLRAVARACYSDADLARFEKAAATWRTTSAP
ncbi:MAG: aminotransferase class I/II-fold pyridoxal phosphate-dependent enzyme [Planctomycetaceae bacterium]